MSDCLLEALTDLRAHGAQISLFDADQREGWFDSLAEFIDQLPIQDQRMAWVVLVANDLCARMPGMPLSNAAMPLLGRLPKDGPRNMRHPSGGNDGLD